MGRYATSYDPYCISLLLVLYIILQYINLHYITFAALFSEFHTSDLFTSHMIGHCDV